MPRLLLVDGNPFLWRAAFSAPMDQVAQKVLTYFVEVMRKFSPDDIVVCWDKGKSRWRSEVFPDYKAHRLQQKKDIDMEGFEAQSGFIRRFLDSLGIRQIRVEGVEADDVLAWLAEYYIEVLGGWSVILTTGDRDLWQLVSEYLSVYDHQRQTFADYNAVQAHFGVAPNLVPDMKSLEGDTSDNLPGVKGVGPKTAAALLREYGGVGNLLNPDNATHLLKKKATAKVLSEGDFIGEMYRLVKIPTLREASACMNTKEIIELEEHATKPLTRDPFRVQMLGEQVGIPFMDFKQFLPKASVDLYNFVTLIGSHGVEYNPVIGSTDIQVLDQTLATCNRCPLRSDCKEKGPNYPQGNVDSDIMLIGRNPDSEDYAQGDIFSTPGAVGTKMVEFLDSIGIQWYECYRTNVCKCHSKDNRPPTYSEMCTCLPYLRSEIDIVKPKLIITFGNEAMAAVTPYTTRVSGHTGEILNKPTGMVGTVDAKVVISVNPTAAIRSERCQEDMNYSATVIKKLLDEVTK